MKEDVKNDQELKSALIKKALGYDTTEVIEEYSLGNEGEIVLSKKKVTKKNVPPDVTALKILIDSEDTPIEEMTDEQLKKEKKRIFEIIAKQTRRKKADGKSSGKKSSERERSGE